MILYTMHIMWYESAMIKETLDSLSNALSYEEIDDVKIKLCLNAQTYIEKPKLGTPREMFDMFLDHPMIKQSEIIYKTDNDPFYNIGDWRREIYDHNYKYTCWGESDCIIPKEYFYILRNTEITMPHILSFASRKSWDNHWYYCEHIAFRDEPPVSEHNPDERTNLIPLRFFDVITQKELDLFNSQFQNPVVGLMPYNQVDGALLALSSNLPTPFIATDMHFAREDLCASLFFTHHGIRQFCVINKLKGHNYKHPLKRTNTDNTREDNVYSTYVEASEKAMRKFLLDLQKS